MIGKIIGNLKLISEIGEGGMGKVYLAEHITLKKRFAVKCLAPELTRIPQFRDRFSVEARAQAQLTHVNIVQVTDFLEHEGNYYLVMEYVEGQSLEDIIKQRGKLQEKEALPIIKDVLNGLNYAHTKGVIHRDIKPSNILIDKKNHAKIMDFGLAILTGEKRLTNTGTNIGSPWYMSPEHINNPKHIDHRSDVYSMGIVLYEMLTGNVPFDGETTFDIQNKHVNYPAPDPSNINPDISKTLSNIILKALEKNPDHRFNGCGEFLEYILEYEKEMATPSPEPKTSKKGLWVFVGILLLLVVCGGIAKMIYDAKESERQRLEAGRKQLEAEKQAQDDQQRRREEQQKADQLRRHEEQRRLEAEKIALEAEQKRLEAERIAKDAEEKKQSERTESVKMVSISPFSRHEDRYQNLFQSLVKKGMNPNRIVEIFTSPRAKEVDMTPIEKMSVRVIPPSSKRPISETIQIARTIVTHLNSYENEYDLLERQFRVNREIVAAIMFKETSLGNFKNWKHEAFTVLNSILSYMEIPEGDDQRSIKRIERIISTSQKSLEGLLFYCDKYRIDILTHRFPSSFSGAIGIPQFLPMYMDYAISINNSVPDLSKMADAILSLGNILTNKFNYPGFIEFDKLREIDQIVEKYKEYDVQKDVSFCVDFHLDGYPLRRFIDDYQNIPYIDYIGKFGRSIMQYNFSSNYVLDVLQLAYYTHKERSGR